MKKFITFIATTLLALALVSCENETLGAQNDPVFGSEAITLTINGMN